MNEKDFVALVDADRVEVGPAPVEEILRSAHSRGRRLSVVVAGLAAAAVVVTIGLVTSLNLGSTPERTDVVTPPEGLVAPTGMRYVGFREFAIAVPEEWGTNEVGCDGVTAVKPSVLFGSGLGARSCLVTANEPILTISELSAGMSTPFVPWDQRRQVNGIDVYLTAPSIGKDGFERQMMSVGERIYFSVKVRDDPWRILGSLARMPQGLVAVPARSALEGYGFRVDLTTEPSREFSTGYVLEMNPPQGTIVEWGSTVHVVEAE